jgi:hypothetical protein
MIMFFLRSISMAVGLIVCASAMSQLLVYKTYDDLVNKTPKTYEKAEFKKWKGDENTVLLFECGGKDVIEVECAGIWGFKYKDATYRISTESKYFVKKSGVQVGIPCVITHQSDVVMYVNGLAFLNATKSKNGTAYISGMCASLSKDLNSPMAALPCDPVNWVDEQVLELVNGYPELSELARDLKALKDSYGNRKGGVFNKDQMQTYLREFDENKAKKGQ